MENRPVGDSRSNTGRAEMQDFEIHTKQWAVVLWPRESHRGPGMHCPLGASREPLPLNVEASVGVEIGLTFGLGSAVNSFCKLHQVTYITMPQGPPFSNEIFGLGDLRTASSSVYAS